MKYSSDYIDRQLLLTVIQPQLQQPMPRIKRQRIGVALPLSVTAPIQHQVRPVCRSMRGTQRQTTATLRRSCAALLPVVAATTLFVPAGGRWRCERRIQHVTCRGRRSEGRGVGRRATNGATTSDARPACNVVAKPPSPPPPRLLYIRTRPPPSSANRSFRAPLECRLQNSLQSSKFRATTIVPNAGHLPPPRTSVPSKLPAQAPAPDGPSSNPNLTLTVNKS